MYCTWWYIPHRDILYTVIFLISWYSTHIVLFIHRDILYIVIYYYAVIWFTSWYTCTANRDIPNCDILYFVAYCRSRHTAHLSISTCWYFDNFAQCIFYVYKINHHHLTCKLSRCRCVNSLWVFLLSDYLCSTVSDAATDVLTWRLYLKSLVCPVTIHGVHICENMVANVYIIINNFIIGSYWLIAVSCLPFVTYVPPIFHSSSPAPSYHEKWMDSYK